MPTLPLSDVVNVVVQISPTATVASDFSLGLIIGKSTIISAVTRVTIYSGLAEMATAGFTALMPEYIAAQLYFSQSPAPTRVAIGRWDGTGSETAVEAVTACRAKNTDWFACYVCDAVAADIEAVAAYIEAAEPSSSYFYTTSDAAVLEGTAGNVMLVLKAARYSKTIGQYSTTPYAAVAIMGYAMGANTGLANSAYTLAYKTEVGVTPEVLTSAQVAIIKGQNGNVYINRGSTYSLFEQGVMASGVHFDEILGLAVLSNAIQIAIMNLLTAVSKVAQTEGGIAQIISAIGEPCLAAKNRGFIAPGIWEAAPILSLSTGDTLSQGYLILAEAIADQSTADRANRITPPIYACIKLAGAIEHLTVQVNVNR